MTILFAERIVTKKFCRIVGTCRNMGDVYVQSHAKVKIVLNMHKTRAELAFESYRTSSSISAVRYQVIFTLWVLFCFLLW
jgi:hypothetical protein